LVKMAAQAVAPLHLSPLFGTTYAFAISMPHSLV
jgi:hypothetical protein